MKSFFITSVGTGIGKTMFTCDVIEALKSRGRKVFAQKPVISGWDEKDNDSYRIMDAMGLTRNEENFAQVTRYRFNAPLSPDIAAKREGKTIDSEELFRFCKPDIKADYHLIEGAGGLMTPVNDSTHTIDWIKALSVPAIVVTGSYLGAISHTLAAIAAADQYKVPLHSIVVSESEHGAIPLSEMATTLKNFTSVPIFLIHRAPKDDRFNKAMPSIIDALEKK